MPKYQVKLSDGRTVTLEAAAPPSEAEVLQALGVPAPMPSHAPQETPERTWTDTAVDALPFVGGAVGGLVGGAAGGLPAVGGAALGGAAGESFRQLANRARGKAVPATSLDAAKDIGIAGAVNAAAEGGGRLLAAGLGKVAGKLYQTALKPTKAATKGDPTRVAQMVKTGLSEGINPTPAGARKIDRIVGGIEGQVGPAIRRAGQAGKTIDPVAIAAEADTFVRPQFRGIAPKADNAAIDAVMDEFMGKGAPIPVDRAFDMARKEGAILAKSFGQRGTAEQAARKSVRHGIRQAVGQAVPEINAPLAREADLLQLAKAVNDRARTGGNLEVLGLGALAPTPANAAAFLLNRWPAGLATAARGAHAAAQSPGAVTNPVRAALLALMAERSNQE